MTAAETSSESSALIDAFTSLSNVSFTIRRRRRGETSLDQEVHDYSLYPSPFHFRKSAFAVLFGKPPFRLWYGPVSHEPVHSFNSARGAYRFINRSLLRRRYMFDLCFHSWYVLCRKDEQLQFITMHQSMLLVAKLYSVYLVPAWNSGGMWSYLIYCDNHNCMLGSWHGQGKCNEPFPCPKRRHAPFFGADSWCSRSTDLRPAHKAWRGMLAGARPTLKGDGALVRARLPDKSRKHVP